MTISGADSTFSNLPHKYLLCSGHHIDIIDCKKKINQKLILLENFIKKSLEEVYDSCKKYTNAHTNDISSDTRNLDICIINAASFNTLVQQVEKAKI